MPTTDPRPYVYTETPARISTVVSYAYRGIAWEAIAMADAIERTTEKDYAHLLTIYNDTRELARHHNVSQETAAQQHIAFDRLWSLRLALDPIRPGYPNNGRDS